MATNDISPYELSQQKEQSGGGGLIGFIFFIIFATIAVYVSYRCNGQLKLSSTIVAVLLGPFYIGYKLLFNCS